MHPRDNQPRKSFILSNESKFMVTGSNCGQWVFRKQGEGLKTYTLQSTVAVLWYGSVL